MAGWCAMFLHFNDAARLALRLADLEARRAGHDHVGTEHLLLALLRLEDCVASRVLARADIELGQVEQEVERLAQGGPQGAIQRRRPLLSPGVRKSVDLAAGAADRLGHARVGTGHLLLGLLEEAEGVAFRALCKLGIGRVGRNLSRVAEHVIAEMKDG